MNIEKLNPWNWFKHEDVSRQQSEQIPVTHNELVPSSGRSSLLQLHREMDRLFDDMFTSFGIQAYNRMAPEKNIFGNTLANAYRPQTDISGDAKKYEVILDVPGLSESDLSIEIKGDILSIKGQKEETSETNEKQFYRVERRFGSFQRTLSLPDDANTDDIKASLQDGVLTLQIPRNQIEDKNVKHIAISS
jgi:HSP20 family protein